MKLGIHAFDPTGHGFQIETVGVWEDPMPAACTSLGSVAGVTETIRGGDTVVEGLAQLDPA